MDAMELFIHVAGFLGGWLLVAGPVYQAALELREQDIDRDTLARLATDAPPIARVSPWWWLLPPVALLLRRRAGRAQQNAIWASMDVAQRKQFVDFKNTSTAWFTVAGGAFLIALKETWELVHLLHLHTAVFWVAIVVMLFIALANTVIRLSRAEGSITGAERPTRATRGSRSQRTPPQPPADTA